MQLSLDVTGPSAFVDSALEEVFKALESRVALKEIVGMALRTSFDEVIDGARTGRYRLEQLEKTEKTYIGTKVEIVLRNKLELQRGDKLDNRICGYEVDTKFSLSGNWMIPREALGELCLLVSGNDNTGKFSVGLIRATNEVLRPGSNQDEKRSISALGKTRIRWLVCKELFPENFLLSLAPDVRHRILSQTSGRQRMRALFENVSGVIIPRSAILQVGQQSDSPKRAREMKAILAAEGIQVLCSTYDIDRVEFLKHGFYNFGKDDWLSIKS